MFLRGASQFTIDFMTTHVTLVVYRRARANNTVPRAAYRAANFQHFRLGAEFVLRTHRMSPAYFVDAGPDHSTLYIDRFHSKAHDDRGSQPSRSAKTAEEGVLACPLIDVERLGIVTLAETDDLSCCHAVISKRIELLARMKVFEVHLLLH